MSVPSAPGKPGRVGRFGPPFCGVRNLRRWVQRTEDRPYSFSARARRTTSACATGSADAIGRARTSLGDGNDIQTAQALPGHKDVKTTMIDTHVLNRGGHLVIARGQGVLCGIPGQDGWSVMPQASGARGGMRNHILTVGRMQKENAE